MWFKDLFEAYEDTYDIQERIKAINSQLRYVKNTTGDYNFPDSIIVPSDINALKDISYIKKMKSDNDLSLSLLSSLMDQCIQFERDYPNINDDVFIDELVNIYSYNQSF